MTHQFVLLLLIAFVGFSSSALLDGFQPINRDWNPQVTISGWLNGKNENVRSNQKYKISVVVYDALLADTDSTINRIEFTQTLRFPIYYSLKVPFSVIKQDNRYALSASIRDQNNNLVYWSDTAVFVNGLINDIKLVRV